MDDITLPERLRRLAEPEYREKLRRSAACILGVPEEYASFAEENEVMERAQG